MRPGGLWCDCANSPFVSSTERLRNFLDRRDIKCSEIIRRASASKQITDNWLFSMQFPLRNPSRSSTIFDEILCRDRVNKGVALVDEFEEMRASQTGEYFREICAG